MTMSEQAVCIKVEHLVKTYGRKRVRALDDVSLDIFSGEIFGLIGPNGAGKTTLMGCLLTLLRPSSGTIKIFGSRPDDLEVKRQCAFLPERPNFDAWMTAKQFMHYHHMLALRPSASARQEIEEALAAVELDPSALNRRVKKFSRGMLQRLGLAQMLVGRPRLCFLDEPGAGMDPLGANLLRNLLLAWKKQNVTVVLNSHHLAEVERVCDRVAFIKEGRIQQVTALAGTANGQIEILVRCASEGEAPADRQLNEVAAEVQGEFTRVSERLLRFSLRAKEDRVRLIRLLVEHQLAVEEVYQEKRGLEELFISIHKEEGSKT
jgi:ABC-2 type transport system ATP-binding protein